MEFSERLPVLYRYDRDKGNESWRDTSPDLGFPKLFLVPQSIASFEAAVSPQHDTSERTQIRADLIGLRESHSTDLASLIIDALIFHLCLPPVANSINRGHFGDAWNWLVFSVTDLQQPDRSSDIEIDRVNRVFGFVLATQIPTINVTIVEWSRWLFYYARKTNALHELCHVAEAIIVPTISARMIKSLVTVDLVCFLYYACWKAFDKREELPGIARRLEELYQNRALSNSNRRQIGITLATVVGEAGELPPHYWASQVLNDFPSSLQGHERIQLLAIAISGADDLEGQWPQIVDEARAYSESLVDGRTSRALRRSVLTRVLDVISPCLTKACDRQRANLVSELLSAFYGIDEADTRRDLVVAHLGIAGVCWFGEGSSHRVHRNDPFVPLESFTVAANNFLGTAFNVSGIVGFDLRVPARPGVPNEEFGEDYLQEALNLYGITSDNPDQIEVQECRAMISMPYNGAPMQTAMLSTCGWTLPVCASLESPKPDKSIERALLWNGGTLDSAVELKPIENILNGAGIETHTIAGADANQERFREVFSSDDYGLVWIAAHGEYDSYSPHKSLIHLAGDNDGESISVEDFDGLTPDSSTRRFLVLNICDGATASLNGSPLGMGIANMLAHSCQAVVSHLWPIDQRIAPVFGVLLASQIATREDSFFECFTNTVNMMRRPKDQILASLNRITPKPTDLIDQFSNRQIDTERFFFWGSAAFIE